MYRYLLRRKEFTAISLSHIQNFVSLTACFTVNICNTSYRAVKLHQLSSLAAKLVQAAIYTPSSLSPYVTFVVRNKFLNQNKQSPKG